MGLFQAADTLGYRNSVLPATSITNPLTWLIDWFGSNETASGQKVDPENAISLTTLFNAITLISESMGMMPFAPHVKKTVTDAKDGSERTNDSIFREHFTYPITARRPHPLISSFNFRKVMYSWACRYDSAYAVIERDTTGKAISMFPIHPGRVQIKLTEDKRYVYEIDGTHQLDPMSVFHLLGYTNDGISGQSRIKIAREAIGKAQAAQQFGAKFFGKGINVSGFIETPKLLKNADAVKRLKESFIKKFGGPNNQFSVGVLEDGAKFTSNETDPEKAQLNETIKMDGLMVAQLLNVPLTMLKFLERGTAYANVEQLAIQFVNFTLIPWGVNWEQECWFKLLTEKEKRQDKISFKFNFNSLLRGDTESRSRFYDVLAKVGAYSPNRILELEDENGYDGGNVHVLSPGAQTIEQIENEADTATQN
jgi:HK97 family phage portal protein